MTIFKLKRKEGQTFHITTWEGDDVELKVLRITPTRVYIEIEAPFVVTIRRGERLKGS